MNATFLLHRYRFIYRQGISPWAKNLKGRILFEAVNEAVSVFMSQVEEFTP